MDLSKKNNIVEQPKEENKPIKKIDRLKNVHFEFDELKMYFGEDYKINDWLTIKQPTIGDILEFGEKRVYNSIGIFVSNTTSYKLQLWDLGIDWNKINDFELFMLLIKSSKKENTSLIFGDIDFASLEPKLRKSKTDPDGTLVLSNEDQSIVIDELLYLHIRAYIRKMFSINPKVEKARGKTTKEMIIDEERENLRIAEMKKENGDSNESSSFLLPLISAMLNHSGFKYKKNELKEVGIVEFMDSVQRLQVYENSRAFLNGMYSGMMDTSKMGSKEKENALNWCRDLSKK